MARALRAIETERAMIVIKWETVVGSGDCGCCGVPGGRRVRAGERRGGGGGILQCHTVLLSEKLNDMTIKLSGTNINAINTVKL